MRLVAVTSLAVCIAWCSTEGGRAQAAPPDAPATPAYLFP